MITKQVSESFRITFENFLAEKDIKWCGNCFAGYKNGLFSYVNLFETHRKQGEDIDIIYRILPDFYVNKETISRSNNCQYTFKMIANSVDKPIDCGIYDYEMFFKSCFDILKSEYDRLFCYDSVTDYAQRMVLNCNLLIEYAGKHQEISNAYGEFANMDLTYLVYYYLKHQSYDECSNLVMNLIGAYKILLYDKIKQGNLSELKEKLSDFEQQKFENLFENYGKLTHFAEALLENNIRFFAQADNIYELKKLNGRKYIQNFLN